MADDNLSSKAKVYVSDDEDEAFVHTFDVQEKLKSKSFPKFFIKEMKGEEGELEEMEGETVEGMEEPKEK